MMFHKSSLEVRSSETFINWQNRKLLQLLFNRRIIIRNEYAKLNNNSPHVSTDENNFA